MPGTLFVVATPIGNLEDVSARALRILRHVALIAAEDTRRTARLLARHGIVTPTSSLHAHNEARKTGQVLDRLVRGEDVALVSDAGTPTVSDPGQRLIRAAAEEGIRIEAIPGPSAVMAALSVSGFSADRFLFLGFPPTKGKDRTSWFDRLRSADGTVVFFEAPHRIRRTLQDLQAQVGDLPAVVCRELTKKHEELVRQPISSVLGALSDTRGEFTIVVNVGQSTEPPAAERPRAEGLANEYSELTKGAGLGRRDALRFLARKYGLSQRDVYATLEGNKE